MAALTRAEMEATLAAGGSVLYGGRLIARVEHLPSEAELAQGNPDAEAVVAEKIQAQIGKLQEQMAKLQEQQTARPKGKG